METRSNYVMVGAVTLSLLAGVLLFIVWLAGLSNQSSKCYDIYFAQAVSGLNKGSGVTFSGVPVGQQTDLVDLTNWDALEVDRRPLVEPLHALGKIDIEAFGGLVGQPGKPNDEY